MAFREYLFISHSLEVGGIETLLVRMANSLVEHGRTVTVASRPGPVGDYLRPEVRFRGVRGEDFTFQDFAPTDKDCEIDIWCSLPSLLVDSWALQRRLWREFGVRSHAVSGIFHPDQWYHQGRLSQSYMVGRIVQALLESGSLYFMNDSTRAAHVKRWGAHMMRFPVRRLHLEENPQVTWRPTGAGRLRIVSVGRIVPFKSYNYDAANLLAELEQNGIQAEWDIFGEGEDRVRLMEVAAAESHIRLNYLGELPYGELQRRLLDYDLFVGMGTAALEAALIGMPVLLALSNVSRGTYGFLTDAPSDSVAELVEGHPPQDLRTYLSAFARMTTAERTAIGKHCAEAVSHRSGDERAPFTCMFSNGRAYPTSAAKALSAGSLLSLQIAWRSLRKNFTYGD